MVPLFTKYLVICRFSLYWVSWFLTGPNAFMTNVPNLMFGELQLWRLVLSPLITTSFWFDIVLIMPIYLCFFCYTKEYHNGTIHAAIYFNLLSKCTNFS